MIPHAPYMTAARRRCRLRPPIVAPVLALVGVYALAVGGLAPALAAFAASALALVAYRGMWRRLPAPGPLARARDAWDRHRVLSRPAKATLIGGMVLVLLCVTFLVASGPVIPGLLGAAMLPAVAYVVARPSRPPAPVLQALR
jgi:hypothetical protein